MVGGQSPNADSSLSSGGHATGSPQSGRTGTAADISIGTAHAHPARRLLRSGGETNKELFVGSIRSISVGSRISVQGAPKDERPAEPKSADISSSSADAAVAAGDAQQAGLGRWRECGEG